MKKHEYLQQITLEAASTDKIGHNPDSHANSVDRNITFDTKHKFKHLPKTVA